jgi:hypothetical protein
VVPTIFNWIQVRAVSRPIYDLERLLSQESLDLLGGTVLKIVFAAVQLHEPEQMVLQHSLVAFAVHCDVFWKKVEATMPQGARKTPSNHNTVRVFHSFDGVAAVKPAALPWPPHFAPDGPQALKRGLIRVHYLGPVPRSPVPVSLGKFELLGFHLHGEKRLLGSNAEWLLQVFLEGPLEGPLGNGTKFRHTVLQVGSCYLHKFDTLSPQHLLHHHCHLFGSARTHFTLWNDELRKAL